MCLRLQTYPTRHSQRNRQPHATECRDNSIPALSGGPHEASAEIS